MQGFCRGPQTLGTYGLLDQEAAGRVKPAAALSGLEFATNATCSAALFLPGAMSTSNLYTPSRRWKAIRLPERANVMVPPSLEKLTLCPYAVSAPTDKMGL